MFRAGRSHIYLENAGIHSDTEVLQFIRDHFHHRLCRFFVHSDAELTVVKDLWLQYGHEAVFLAKMREDS